MVNSVSTPQAQAKWLDAIARMRLMASSSAADLDQIQDDITTGVSLPLLSQPPPVIFSNTPAVNETASAVRARLADYMDFGAVEELPPDTTPPHGIQPLHVIIKEGKKPRLVIDLSRNLNQFLEYRHFTYSKVDDAVALASPGCWFGKLDLSNCFLSFPLHPDAIRFFYFRFDGRLYRFVRMPFGLSTAPLVCTQLLSVPAWEMQQRGCRFIRYLDDFLFIASSAEALRDILQTAQEVFASFGLLVNSDKTEGPVQRISFLGIQIDSIEQTTACTPARVHELLQLLATLGSKSTVRRKDVESLIGKLSFAAQVLPGARPFMRHMLDAIHPCAKRSTPVRINECFREDVSFWLSNLTNWNGKQRWRAAQSAPIVLATDASLSGFGFHIVEVPPHIDATRWPIELQTASGFYGSYHQTHADLHASHRQIAWCELLAILAAARTYSSQLRDNYVLFLVDNSTDVAIVNRQSTRSPRLGKLLRCLYKLALDFNFSIRAAHIAGVDNSLADFLSRPELHHNDPLTSAQAVPAVRDRLRLCSAVCSSHFLPQP
jgi:hypothetical protein